MTAVAHLLDVTVIKAITLLGISWTS